ncbi:UNKNOWN [Stylonychia lemnae]|uniref:Uncharacterized protein n=1 Tax=Stylonychia lemnae TaxID=5949 RepID=A0A078AAR7_STYLE|nr:UNKNOWN [Stylonychia lemnae]|eukprot:CDW78946.1 UNKNOWN [Stylonychia lemnae]
MDVFNFQTLKQTSNQFYPQQDRSNSKSRLTNNYNSRTSKNNSIDQNISINGMSTQQFQQRRPSQNALNKFTTTQRLPSTSNLVKNQNHFGDIVIRNFQQKNEQSFYSNHNQQDKSVYSPDTSATYSKTLQVNSNIYLQNDMVQQIQRYEEQLKFLDNYRIICEKRILDLQPSHPLPVLPSHIGQSNSRDEEFTLGGNQTPCQFDALSIIQSKRDSLNQQEIERLRVQVDDLLSEKQQMVDALNKETLMNEQQKAQIQILKNSLDERLTNQNLDEFLVKSQNNLMRGMGPSDSYILIQEMKNEIDTKSSSMIELIQKNEQLEQQYKQVTEVYYDYKSLLEKKTLQLAQLEKDHSILSQNYQKVKQDFDQAEKDKDQLLDCIEENSLQFKSFNGLIESEREKVEEITQQKQMYKHLYQEAQDNLNLEAVQTEKFKMEKDALSKKVSELEGKLKEMKLDLKGNIEIISKQTGLINESNSIIEELNKQIQNQQDLLQNKQNEIKDNFDKSMEELQQQLQQFKESNDQISNELESHYQQELDSMQQNLETEKKRYDETRQKQTQFIEKQAQDLIAFEEQVKELNNENMQMQKQNNELNEYIEILNQEVQRLKSSEESLNSKFEIVKQEILEKEQQFNAQKNCFDEGKANLAQSINENQKLTQVQATLTEEIRIYVEENKKIQQDNERLIQKIQDQDQDVENLRSLVRREQLENKDLKEEIEQQKSKTYEIELLLKEAQRKFEQIQREYEIVQNQNSLLVSEKQIYDKLIQDLKEYELREAQNEESLKQASEKIEMLNSTIEELKVQIIEKSQELSQAKDDNRQQYDQFIDIKQQLMDTKTLNESVTQEKKTVDQQLCDISRKLYELINQMQDQDNKYEQVMDQLNKSHQQISQLNSIQEHSQREKEQILAQYQVMKQQVQEFTNSSQQWSFKSDNLNSSMQKIIIVLKQFFDSMVQNKDLIEDLITEELFNDIKGLYDQFKSIEFIENIDQSISISSKLVEILNLVKIIQEKVIQENQQSKQDLRVMDDSIQQLEQRLSSIYANDVYQQEKQQQLSTEIEQLKETRQKDQQENENLKRNLDHKSNLIDQLHRQLNELKNQKINLSDSDAEFKEQQIKLLNKEIKDYEEFIQLVYQNTFKGDQYIQEELQLILNILRDRYNEENLKLKYEVEILNYENELQSLLQSNSKVDQVSHAQRIKNELVEIERRIELQDRKVIELAQRENQLKNQLLFDLESSIKNKSMSQDNDQTVVSLFKETQSLQNELQNKNKMIIELQNQIILSRSANSPFQGDYLSSNHSQSQIEDNLKSASSRSPFSVKQNSFNYQMAEAKALIEKAGLSMTENEKPKKRLNILNLRHVENYNKDTKKYENNENFNQSQSNPQLQSIANLKKKSQLENFNLNLSNNQQNKSQTQCKINMRELISPEGSSANLLQYLKKNNPYSKDSKENIDRLQTQSDASLKTEANRYSRHL